MTSLTVVAYGIIAGVFIGTWVYFGSVKHTLILFSTIGGASAAGVFLGFWGALGVLTLWFGATLIIRRKAIKNFFEMTPDVKCLECRYPEHLCDCPGAERRKIQDAFFSSLKFTAVVFASIGLTVLVSETYLEKNVYDNFLVLEQGEKNE